MTVEERLEKRDRAYREKYGWCDCPRMGCCGDAAEDTCVLKALGEAVEAEREACARVAEVQAENEDLENSGDSVCSICAEMIAAAIRARGDEQ